MAPNGLVLLQAFLQRSPGDVRIGPSHISLFIAIFYRYCQNGEDPVCFLGSELALQSKLSSRTYYKCIGELHQYGYIRYVPSCNPALRSVAYLTGI